MTPLSGPSSGRPLAEHPRDVVPTPDEFAGWPRLGVESASLAIGPVGAQLARIDRAVLDSLGRWATTPGGGLVARDGWAGLDIHLEFTRADRDGYLALIPGTRTRLLTWPENGGLVMATHGAALLMNEDASRGIVVIARQLDPDLDLALQNVLRVAVAWRLVLGRRGLLLHGAAVEHGDAALLLLGPSGAGKSTALRLSAPRPALADDVVILTAPRSSEGAWLAHPTPLWAEPAFPSRSSRLSPLPLAGALRLHHGPAPRLASLSRATAAASVLAHAPFLPKGREDGVATLAERLVRDVPLASLEFNLDGGFWPTIESWQAGLAPDVGGVDIGSRIETEGRA